MKKTPSKSSSRPARRVASQTAQPDEMRLHYDFDYSKARPNRFAERLAGERVAVVLEPDVAAVFQSAESVNSFLRSAITAMPQAEPRKQKRSAYHRRLTPR